MSHKDYEFNVELIKDGRILARADPGPGEKVVVAPIDIARLRDERDRLAQINSDVASRNARMEREVALLRDELMAKRRGAKLAKGLLEKIPDALAEHDLEARVIPVGCIGMCFAEPLVDVQEPGKPRVSYRNVKPKVLPQILEGQLKNGGPPEKWVYGTLGDGSYGALERLEDMAVLAPQKRIALRNCGYIDPDCIEEYIAKKGYQALLKTLENGLFMIPQSFGVLTTHAPCRPAECRVLTWPLCWLKQIQVRSVGVDVVKIGIDQNKIAMRPPDFFNIMVI